MKKNPRFFNPVAIPGERLKGEIQKALEYLLVVLISTGCGSADSDSIGFWSGIYFCGDGRERQLSQSLYEGDTPGCPTEKRIASMYVPTGKMVIPLYANCSLKENSCTVVLFSKE